MEKFLYKHFENWRCWFGHKWDMYAGYDQIRVHSQAKCERCGIKYGDS